MSMTHDEMIAVITHHKNGGEIEFKTCGDNQWCNFPKGENPSWDFYNNDYRIKPELLVLWAEYKDNEKLLAVYQSEQEPKYGGTLKKFVEVTE